MSSVQKSEKASASLTIEYAVLEDSPDILEDIDIDIKKVVDSVHRQFKQVNQNGRIKVAGVIPSKLFDSTVEEDFKSKLIENAQLDESPSIPDIVVLDNNLPGNPESGKEVLEETSKRRYPLDAVLYTNLPDIPDLEHSNPYGRIWTTSRDDLKPTLLAAATKFYLFWTNPEYIRGLVLSRFADLDIAWNELVVTIIHLEDEPKESSDGRTKETIRELGKEILREFALTRDGLELTRKAKNINNVAKLLEDSKIIAPEITKDIERFVRETIAYSRVRDDFAHNPITNLDGERIGIRAKDPPKGGYTRKVMKSFFIKWTRLIIELEQVTEKIKPNREREVEQ
jgi:hypothetical protein